MTVRNLLRRPQVHKGGVFRIEFVTSLKPRFVFDITGVLGIGFNSVVIGCKNKFNQTKTTDLFL